MFTSSRLEYDHNRDQAAATSTDHTDLPFDPDTGLILAGPHRGLPARDMYTSLVQVHRLAGHDVHTSHRIRRPWWRLFKPTPTWRVSIHKPSSVPEVNQ